MSVEERVHGGKVFRECWALIEAEAATLSPAAAENFWTAFQDAMREKFPDKRNQPMTTLEFAEFSSSKVPFGMYGNREVGDMRIPLEYLTWLANQTFIDDLRRYLKHPCLVQQIERLNSQKFREYHDDDEGLQTVEE